jgi:hypothetical protein
MSLDFLKSGLSATQFELYFKQSEGRRWVLYNKVYISATVPVHISISPGPVSNRVHHVTDP